MLKQLESRVIIGLIGFLGSYVTAMGVTNTFGGTRPLVIAAGGAILALTLFEILTQALRHSK